VAARSPGVPGRFRFFLTGAGAAAAKGSAASGAGGGAGACSGPATGSVGCGVIAALDLPARLPPVRH
jgi:hypothetical protein